MILYEGQQAIPGLPRILPFDGLDLCPRKALSHRAKPQASDYPQGLDGRALIFVAFERDVDAEPRLGQGRDKTMAHLSQDPATVAKLRALLLERASNLQPVIPVIGPPPGVPISTGNRPQNGSSAREGKTS